MTDDLERRLRDAEGRSDTAHAARASELAGIEGDLRRACARGGDEAALLADTARWRDLLRAGGCEGARGAADALLDRIVATEAERWRAGLGSAGDAEAAFADLARAGALDLEALRRRGAPAPLLGERPALHARLLSLVQASPPDEATRERWATMHLDRAVGLLGTLDGVDPATARAQIDLVRDDLVWHMQQVEASRGPRRSRLGRKARRLAAERQERGLRASLERRFGARRVERFDRALLLVLAVVLAMLAAEFLFTLPHGVVLAFTAVDTLACLVFLWEFAYKLAVVEGKGGWFARHFLVDLLPSIPFGLLLLPHQMDAVRAGRAARFLRLPRLARYLRAFTFLTRGIDRLARQHGPLLDRDIILFPSREERERARAVGQGDAAARREMRTRLAAAWERLLQGATPDARDAVGLARLDALGAALAPASPRPPHPLHAHPRGEGTDSTAEAVITDLASLTPAALEARIEADLVVRLARVVRLFALPPFRWFPVLRRYAPRLAPGLDDAEVVVAAAHRAAAEFERHLERWTWYADLSGTVSPAQFVDRLGTTMVKGAFRPAYRLALFGGIYLIVSLLLKFSRVAFLEALAAFFGRIVGPFLQVLGAICFAILGVGWYLRRVAGQATEFFSQSVQAQYLGLTESIKSRALERDGAILEGAVFRAEARITGEEAGEMRQRFVRGVRRWLLEAQSGGGRSRGFDTVERAVLIHRDSLDGTLLGESDTRTTAQLLGNPALRNLRLRSARFTRRHRKRLLRLDLERNRSLFRGPYLWFSLVCHAVSYGAARLIVDYNRFALPLDQLPHASEEERRAYEEWLASGRVADVAGEQVLYTTTSFTALHFLDADPERDRLVEERFGPRLRERLELDRRLLARRIFGTYPLHRRPREERVLNLARLHEEWLAGGRALLIPLRVLARSVAYSWRFFRWMRSCLREIRHPAYTVDREAAQDADYATALRKIQRMRGPAAEEAMRLRALLDPEYLGARIPGTTESGLEGALLADHLRFLRARPRFVTRMQGERRRAARDMERLGRLLEGGLRERIAARLGLAPGAGLGPERMRALAAVYLADYDGVRRLLSAAEILSETYARAAQREPLPPRVLPRPRLKRAFNRWWRAHGTGRDRAARRAAWSATVANLDGAGDALRVWAARGDAARAEGESALVDLLRHPERITDPLVTLRIVQTESLIDLLHYRGHIHRLGAYDEAPGDALALGGMAPS